jgi:hypothetical protein
MKSLFNQLIRSLRRKLWAVIVAYMLGMHNFYTGEHKTADNIAIKTEYNEVQEKGTPKD